MTQVSTEKQLEFQAVNLSQFYDLTVKLWTTLLILDTSEN